MKKKNTRTKRNNSKKTQKVNNQPPKNYDEDNYKISKNTFYMSIIATVVTLVISIVNIIYTNYQLVIVKNDIKISNEKSKPYFTYKQIMGETELTYDILSIYDLENISTLKDIYFDDVYFEINNVGAFIRDVTFSMEPYLLFAKFDSGLSTELEEYYCRMGGLNGFYKNFNYETQELIIKNENIKLIYYYSVLSDCMIKNINFCNKGVLGDIECIPKLFFKIEYTDIYGEIHEDYYLPDDGVLVESNNLHDLYAKAPYNNLQYRSSIYNDNKENMEYVISTIADIVQGICSDNENWYRVSISECAYFNLQIDEDGKYIRR